MKRWKRFLLFRFRINHFEQPFSGQRDLIEPLESWGCTRSLPSTPQLFLPSETDSKLKNLLPWSAGSFVALAPSAAHFLKRWPKGHWQDLIRLSPQEKFVLLGGPEDHFLEDLQTIAPERVLNLAGKLSLLQSAQVVKMSRYLVSNDTGLVHVAEQLGHPATALMGPAPFGFPSRSSTKILERNLPCRPCSKHGQGPCRNPKFHECLVSISPEEVRGTFSL